MTAPAPGEARAYPLRNDDGHRFTFGLAVDVAGVLERHGYPPLAGGLDLVELQQALFRFLYGPAGGDDDPTGLRYSRPVDTGPPPPEPPGGFPVTSPHRQRGAQP